MHNAWVRAGWAFMLGWLVGCGTSPETPPAPSAVAGDSRPLAALPIAERVKDIALATLDASPKQMVDMGDGTALFTARDELHGRELWRSDGTAAGTVRVKDVNPGAADTLFLQFARVGKTLFFVRGDSVHWIGDLWKSDGTEAGTVLVKHFSQGLDWRLPRELTDVNGTLFFVATAETGHEELWKSDGTEAGTVRLKSIALGGEHQARALRATRDRLFFLADQDDRRTALWTSDGTEAGTVLLRTFTPPDPTGSAVGMPSALDDVLLLPVYSNTHGELWRSDGTARGTVPLQPPHTSFWGVYVSHPQVRVGNTLYFLALDDTNGLGLWTSDGTNLGTRFVQRLGSEEVRLSLSWMIAAKGGVFLCFWDARGFYTLWKSDGTAAGTGRVQDLPFVMCCRPESSVLTVGDTLYFVRLREEDPALPDELWTSDGTASGTRRLSAFHSGHADPRLNLGASVRGRLLFSADDGFHGGELWTSDGREAGTRLVTDINAATRGASPSGLTNVAGTLYFSASGDDNTRWLWKSEGASTARVDLPDAAPTGAAPRNLTDADGTLYFSANDKRGVPRLWKSDGTRAGTVRLGDEVLAQGDFTLLHGTLFFRGSDPETGLELWKSDGTAAGTVRVKDLRPGQAHSSPMGLVVFQDRLYFSASDVSGGRGLWRSDGTEAGTVLVKDFGSRGGPDFQAKNFVETNGRLVFGANDGTCGTLWATDGTEAGTVPLQDCPAPGLAFAPEDLTRVGDAVFFSAMGPGGRGLWKTDGTRAGTVPVKQGRPREEFAASGLVNAEGVLFFVANDGVHGYELWKSDGTEAGTQLVKDILPGGVSSAAGPLTAVGGRVFMGASDGVHGVELWVSDGTEAGTRMLADLSPGESGSSPSLFTRVGNWLYFSARDPLHGEELWRVSLSNPGAPPPEQTPGEVPAPPASPEPSAPGGGKPETPATEVTPPPVPDAEVSRLGCGVTSGVQASLWVGLLGLGWLLLSTGSRRRNASRGWKGWAAVLGLLAAVGIESRALAQFPEPQPVPHLVKDIFLPTRSSSPTGFVTLGSTVFFSAGEDVHGRALWKSDGTRAGTVLVKAVCQGMAECGLSQLTRVGNALLFVTSGGANPTRLWRSDGTEAGTWVIQEYVSRIPGTVFQPRLSELTDVAGTLYFVLAWDASAMELWKSDGTRAGTVRMRGFQGDINYEPHALRNANGLLFFLTQTPWGVAVWRSDGTQEGTLRLREFRPRSRASPAVGVPEVLGDRLIFPVTAQEGSQLWSSDGTVTGTIQVGPTFPWFTWQKQDGMRPVRMGSALFFLVEQPEGRGLWRSDGTNLGTMRVKELVYGGHELTPTWLMGARNTLYLQLRDPSRGGDVLWKSDGTEAGTVHLQELPFRLCCESEAPRMAVDDAVYLVRPSPDAYFREQLWRIDGTAGARLVQEFSHPLESRQLVLGASLGGRLVFAANEGLHGGEPWLSDGTASGTRLVADLQTNTGGADLSWLTRVKDTLYFSALEGEPFARLWKSDGSAEGTQRVDFAPPEVGRSPWSLLEVEGMLYFLALDAQDKLQLWKSDGTRAGSARLSQLAEGIAPPLVHLKGRLYFWSYDRGAGSWALWSSDGTEAGLKLVRTTWVINPPNEPPGLIAWRDALYFGGEQSVGFDLWRSDGTPEGTAPFKHFDTWSQSGQPRQFVDLGDSLLFQSGEDVGSWWKSDGTAEGTVPLLDAQGHALFQVTQTGRVNGTFFFTAWGQGRPALWKHRGHGVAPELFVDDLPSAELEVVGGTLYFCAGDKSHGAELWKSDGTAAGTRLVKDMRPGPESSAAWDLTAVDGRLFFSANDGVHGREAWVSDGTDAGTALVADLAPGAASSSPSRFTRAGDSLFFTAWDLAHGTELWRLPLPVAPEPPPKQVPGEIPAPPAPTPGEAPASLPGEVTAPPVSPPTGHGATETPAVEAASAPEPDAEVTHLGCGVTSGLPGALWSGLLLLGALRARRPRRTP